MINEGNLFKIYRDYYKYTIFHYTILKLTWSRKSSWNGMSPGKHRNFRKTNRWNTCMQIWYYRFCSCKGLYLSLPSTCLLAVFNAQHKINISVRILMIPKDRKYNNIKWKSCHSVWKMKVNTRSRWVNPVPV